MRAADESIARRIDSCLAGDQVCVMWCFDNGHGLDSGRMFRLLEDGAGSKGADDESRGSFGLGHLQPFGASDLRYILYGGRVNNPARLLSSGQAILAVHQHGNGRFRTGTGILAEELDTSNTLFERHHTYGDVPLVEDRLATWLESHEARTGTVVGVLGFNMFGANDESHFVDVVFDAAAKHFSVALLESGFTVTIVTHDGRSRELSDGHRRLIDKRRGDWENEVNRSKVRGRLLPGLFARRTYDTWTSGNRSEAADCDLWVRTLAERGQPTRVNVFRDGMWITYEAPGLESRDFNDTRTFDAIVNITSRAKLYRLVKKAEPSTHLEIDRRRLDRLEQEDYDSCIEAIAAKLKEIAGEPLSDQEYEDPNFAPVEGISVRRKAARPLNPHPPPSPTPEPGPEPGPGPEPRPEPPPPVPDPTPPEPPGPGPNPDRPRPSGQPAGHVVSAVKSGGIRVDAIVTDVPESGSVAVTLVRHSGSDRSCDRFVHPMYITLRSIVTADGTVHNANDEANLEILVSSADLQAGPFNVYPVDPLVVDYGIEVVLRRRRGHSL